MIDKKYVLLYSEKYEDLINVLPKSSVKIKVDKKIAVVFRATVIPTLIIYKGTNEQNRITGTKNIKDYFDERVNIK